MTDASRSRPAGLRRVALRMPVYLYRLGLGRLVGRRFLLLSHRGRRTGKRRETVLEVIHADHRTGECFVASGWGPGSDWYRNLRHAEPIEVRIGRRRATRPRRRFVDHHEALAVYESYQRTHPRSARLGARWAGLQYDESPATRVDLVRAMPIVAIELGPRSGSET